MTPFRPDCSDNDWTTTQEAINILQRLVPEGFGGICHKVHEGKYYEDPYWPAIQHWYAASNVPGIGCHESPPTTQRRRAYLEGHPGWQLGDAGLGTRQRRPELP